MTTISNLSAGVMSILLGSFLQAWNTLLKNMYELVRDQACAPTRRDRAGIPADDLGYYWFHRLSHEVQIMAGHGVSGGFAYNLSARGKVP